MTLLRRSLSCGLRYNNIFILNVLFCLFQICSDLVQPLLSTIATLIQKARTTKSIRQNWNPIYQSTATGSSQCWVAFQRSIKGSCLHPKTAVIVETVVVAWVATQTVEGEGRVTWLAAMEAPRSLCRLQLPLPDINIGWSPMLTCRWESTKTQPQWPTALKPTTKTKKQWPTTKTSRCRCWLESRDIYLLAQNRINGKELKKK